MAKFTLNAAVQVDGSHIATRSTDDALGTDIAALIFDGTKTKYEVQQGVAALMRNLNRLFLRTDKPSEIPLTGTDRE